MSERDHGNSPTSLSESDSRRLEGVERALVGARDLRTWWRTEGGQKESFPLPTGLFHGGCEGVGFFDQAVAFGQATDVMGLNCKQLFDRPKQPDLDSDARDWLYRQAEEFVLRYFSRVCGELTYYKKVGEKVPYRFPPPGQRRPTVDLRELGRTYEWIVVKVRPSAAHLPLAEEINAAISDEFYLVLSEDFILGELGRYGLGYAFLRDLDEDRLGHGPGHFDTGFQTIRFDVDLQGEIFCHTTFVASRPRKVTNVSLDPVKWSMKLAEMASFGMLSDMLGPVRKTYGQLPQIPGIDLADLYIRAARTLSKQTADRLCISRKQLERNFLNQHFKQHSCDLSRALMIWRQVPDWLDRDHLPEWV